LSSCEESEHISSEQPYRLKPENRAQITKYNPGDMSLKLNHISPEENAENSAQNEQFRRSGDTGDICSQRIIVITIIITQFLIVWYMIT
jgi:hypothetical protein